MKSSKILFMLAGVCFVVCGCNFYEPSYECDKSFFYPYWTEWSDGRLASIVDDSLAIFVSNKYKNECINNEEYKVSSRTILALVNYRVKQKPLSVDTFHLDFNEGKYQSYDYSNPYFIIPDNFFRDSSVLVFDKLNKRYGFWKIGNNLIDFKKYIYSEENYALNKARPWISESVLLINDYGANAILSTKNNRIDAYAFPEKYKWVQDCNDVSYIGDKIVCTRNKYEVKYEFDTYYLELVVDGVVTNTIQKSSSTSFLGNNYILVNRDKIFKIDMNNFKFSNTFKPIYLSGEDVGYIGRNCFYEEENRNDPVKYSGQDLIEYGKL